MTTTGLTGRRFVAQLAPGLALCVIVGLAASLLDWMQHALLGRGMLDVLVLAILVGMFVRLVSPPSEVLTKGVEFAAKYPLELGIVALGGSFGADAIASLGGWLLIGIVAVVSASLLIGFAGSRWFGLSTRTALLVACGSSICGNSAIAAVAPIVDADADEVAASIGFTAALGIVFVLVLPAAASALSLTPERYGMLSGLTVYAVPQVLAAAAPGGALAVQVGTLVKLVRVLLLGPVCLAISLAVRSGLIGTEDRAGTSRDRRKVVLPRSRMIPWFIVGFMAMLVLRTFDAIPHAALAPLRSSSTALTVLAMAGLGVGVDVRTLAASGGRVILAAVTALLTLTGLSLALLHVLPLP